MCDEYPLPYVKAGWCITVPKHDELPASLIGANIIWTFPEDQFTHACPLVQNHLLEVDAKKAAGPTWETVRYMVSEIQYGGRITDDFDQLLMDTYAEKYFHQEVTRPGFELYKDERASISYKIPESSEIEGFRKVRNLDLTVNHITPVSVFALNSPHCSNTFCSLLPALPEQVWGCNICMAEQ